MDREIETLKKNLLSLCAAVEAKLWQAIKSLHKHDAKLAREIVNSDIEIDQMEVNLEEECLKILALHQPVAIDLRFIITALKINNDLERIGDLAVNVAERSEYLASHPVPNVQFDFQRMAEITQAMLRNSLDALVNMDCKLAREVCTTDDKVDQMNREMYAIVKQGVRDFPDHIEELIHMLSISRHLERIADHATNIAEDVIYMVHGEIVRHHTETYPDK